jgi:hypothetical protein
LYAKAEPRLVFSVDHGHFFPGGPNWTVATLEAHAATAAVPDPAIVQSCNLTGADIRAANAALAGLEGSRVVALAVAAPLDDWGLLIEERVAMANHLTRRRRSCLWRFPGCRRKVKRKKHAFVLLSRAGLGRRCR